MKTVLIVDDAAFMRMILRRMLEKNGYQVVAEAEDGNDALEQYNKHNPDIVTMDITMPGYDGIWGISEIMKVDPRANVIMCSAMGQRDYILEAVQLGAKDFIVKPFVEARVLEALEKSV